MRLRCISDTIITIPQFPKRGRQPLRNLLLASIVISASANMAHAQATNDQASQTNQRSQISKQKQPITLSQASQNNPVPPPLSSVTTLNDVIVTGTRDTGTKARASATPIVVISGRALQNTGQVTLRDALEQLTPSIARQASSGVGETLTDVLTIHGLNPNDVLVLVNGKRRHTTADIQQDMGLEQGATGVDIDLIPVSAIDHIEILLGGDSAQYGSDAIAGVINIILKSADHGGSVETTEGQYYAGDGFSRDLSANGGTSLGENGFLNLSAEYAGQDHTNRTWIDPQTGRRSNEQEGDPATNRELLAFNSGYYLNDGIELYGFGTYGHRGGEAYENYRLPSSLVSPVTGLPVFPGGFPLQQTISEDDYSVTAGVKGEGLGGWKWDLSSTYGRDYDDLGLISSANPSLYEATGYTPTSFHLESLVNSEWTNNLDLSRPFTVPGLPSPLTVSWGAEHRLDAYRIGAGDPASYYGSGAQDPGLQPFDAGTHFRNSEAGYLDLGTKLTPQWYVDAAGRFEHYSDVGNTVNGKFTTRYDFNPEVAVRGSVGTGFQAPTLAEEYFSNLDVAPTLATGLLPPNSAAAKSLGATPLKPEKSTNFDAGLVLDPWPSVNLTVDAYQIDINDNIVVGGTTTGAAAVAAFAAEGIHVPATVLPYAVSADYFTNGVDTRTRGVDIASNYLQDLGDFGDIHWDLSANINDTEVTGIKKNAQGIPELNAQHKDYLTQTTPKFKIRAGGSWQGDEWGFSLHENMYGPTSDDLTYFTGPNTFSSTVFYHFTNPTAFTTDIEMRYRFARNWELAGGADNLFDAKPKSVPTSNQYLGAQYDLFSSQIGIDGGYYYARIRYLF